MKEKTMSNIPLWMNGAVAVVLFVAVSMAIPVIKKSLRERRKALQREFDQQLDQIRQVLAGKKFHVTIRTVNSTRTDMETTLIGRMVDAGIRVVQKPDQNVLILTGVYQVTEYMGLIRAYNHWLDLRVNTPEGEIRAAKNVWGEDERNLALNSLRYLASALK